MPRSRKQPAKDSRLAYQQRVQAQFGQLRKALDAGFEVSEAAQRAGMDVGIALAWSKLPADMWPNAA